MKQNNLYYMIPFTYEIEYNSTYVCLEVEKGWRSGFVRKMERKVGGD